MEKRKKTRIGFRILGYLVCGYLVAVFVSLMIIHTTHIDFSAREVNIIRTDSPSFPWTGFTDYYVDPAGTEFILIQSRNLLSLKWRESISIVHREGKQGIIKFHRKGKPRIYRGIYGNYEFYSEDGKTHVMPYADSLLRSELAEAENIVKKVRDRYFPILRKAFQKEFKKDLPDKRRE